MMGNVEHPFKHQITIGYFNTNVFLLDTGRQMSTTLKAFYSLA